MRQEYTNTMERVTSTKDSNARKRVNFEKYPIADKRAMPLKETITGNAGHRW